MKYLLILQVDAEVLELTEAERASVRAGRDEFRRIAEEAGEMISSHALADPTTSTVISSRGIRPGPFRAASVGGYYLVDVESKARAIELADLLPDTRIDGLAVEIRPIMLTAGADY
ncbi:hypothetical protein F1D05_13570 [Kribbella qitaiheensis]|uniref:YCII-related domain-containing protein n=1 Tax=Kribbella qitaiheensis TaxID=1544730 RepID=A0A7G6WXN1_9ACTN|nr:YciI family protein [Kribbella qitaiheensis]QNE18746.1 hypothetical protein F1D05_13570 [Kribbella qitaiheensis]